MPEALTPLETQLLGLDHGTPWHVTEVTVLAGDGLAVDEVAARVAERLPYVPRFTHKAAQTPLAATWLPDPDDDVAAHVRLAPLPEKATLGDVERHVAESTHAFLPRDHARWDIGVVGSLRGRRSALITRVHPAWVDGRDHVHLGQELFDDTENPDPPVGAAWPTVEAGDGVGSGVVTDVLSTVTAAVREPATVWAGVGAMVGGLRSRFGRLASPSPSRRALHVGGTGVSTDGLETVAAAFGCTPHDVVVAMVAGGLARLGRREETIALAPRAVEDESGTSALGFTLAPVRLALPVAVDDSVRRLADVASLTATTTETGRTVAPARLAEVPGHAPATWHTLAARLGASDTVASVLISEAVGAPTPRWFGTRAVKASYCVVCPTPAQRLTVTVTATAGHAWFGLCGLDPVAPLAVAMIDELQDLRRRAEEVPC